MSTLGVRLLPVPLLPLLLLLPAASAQRAPHLSGADRLLPTQGGPHHNIHDSLGFKKIICQKIDIRHLSALDLILSQTKLHRMNFSKIIAKRGIQLMASVVHYVYIIFL